MTKVSPFAAKRLRTLSGKDRQQIEEKITNVSMVAESATKGFVGDGIFVGENEPLVKNVIWYERTE